MNPDEYSKLSLREQTKVYHTFVEHQLCLSHELMRLSFGQWLVDYPYDNEATP